MMCSSRVYLKTNVDSQELKVVDLVSSQQVLLVKVVLQDEINYEKVIY
jgi:hypothetical protein